MSNTITIKDPNGNIVCSVENVDPIRSEEGFDLGKMYQDITNVIVPILPDGWEKVKLYCQIDKSSYEFFYYTYIHKKYVYCYSDDMRDKYGVYEDEIGDVFDRLYKILLPDQRSKKWYVATISVDKSGKINCDYEYKDYSESQIEYKKMWEKKYIK